MASLTTDIEAEMGPKHLQVRRIMPADLKEVLAKGLDDFAAMPTFAIFLAVIYPIVGLVLLRLTFGYDMLPMVFPLVAGFPLVGPLAAIGLYEMSRRRERGLDVSLDALQEFRAQCLRDIMKFGILLTVIFLLWLGAAVVIYELTFGNWVPLSVTDFAQRILTTHAGWTLIVVGCVVGFLFAVVAFSVSVVSIPLLLDRDVGFSTAVSTSIRVVADNPTTMALWALIITTALLLGSLPFLFGLAVVLPILGHATWHLYRKTVEH